MQDVDVFSSGPVVFLAEPFDPPLFRIGIFRCSSPPVFFVVFLSNSVVVVVVVVVVVASATVACSLHRLLHWTVEHGYSRLRHTASLRCYTVAVVATAV